MLSLDLFDSRFEKKLHEGALDDTITRTQAHLMEPLSRRAADIRTQIRSGKLSAAELDKLEKEYEDLVQKRQDIMFNRKSQTQEQQPVQKTPVKGIGDIQDPKTKMAQLGQQAKKGPLANVGAGLKAFIKGEPEPMGEEQQQSPRALGAANFQRLVKANMGNIPTVNLEFIRPDENFKLDQTGLDLISDYYDGLETDQAKNYFIYRVLPSGEETRQILKQLGWNPQQMQQPLPGIPTQGELPLQEKKKFKNDSDLEAGSVKVARELQKLRAQYPAAKSDVEAVASAEIDSSERSQQQLAAIRGANEKQDSLLKQLVALDQEQGQEIDGLDKENDSLEQRLAQVQATNDQLQQTIGKMTGTKKAATTTATQTGSADMAQGGIVDVSTAGPSTPNAKTGPTTSTAMDYTAQQLAGFANQKPLGSMRPAPGIGKTAINDPTQPGPKVSGSDIKNESNMSELDAMRQDLERMNDRQFYTAYGISKAAFQQKYRTLLKPALDEDQRLHQGDPVIVTAPNEFEGKTGEIYDFAPSGTFVIVDLYNHGKHSMHLSDVEYNQYADDQEQDDWYDEEVAEGYQDFNKVEPYAVCLAGKPVKKFDYYEEARRFHDNWKKKLYNQGDKEKADKITLMPLNLDEGTVDNVEVTSDDQTETYRYKGWQFIETANDYYSGEAWLVDPDGNEEWFGYQTDDNRGIRKYYNDQDQLAFSLSARDEGQSTEKWLKAQASNWMDTWHAQPNAPVVHEQGIAEAGDRVDPILIKALNNMPDGLATHREVLDAAYDAYTMEVGKIHIKQNYGVTHAYIPKLMGLYKDKHGLTFNEEQKPAGWGEFPPKQEITIIPPKKLKSGETYQDQNKYWQSQGQAPIYKTNEEGKGTPVPAKDFVKGVLKDLKKVKVKEVKADPAGSWIVYSGSKVMKFKTHSGAKAYAEKNGGKVASSEHYHDKIQKSGVAETALNTQDPKGDLAAKRKALQDLSMNKAVDQAAVQQRSLDLDREAKSKGLVETVTDVKAGMAKIYHKLAPKIERNRDSFLAGQLYDELENYAELHGAEGEFKRMMNSARNRAHMEYDTNPGGFHNWFWFLPFEDQDVSEGDDQLLEGIKDTASATAVIACLLAGGNLSGCATAPQQTTTAQAVKTGQDLGRIVYNARNITRAGTQEEAQQELRNILRGMTTRPEEMNTSNIMRIWQKVNGSKQQNEAKDPRTKQEYDRAVDSVMNQLAIERDAAVRQMLGAQLKVLQDRGRVEGWHKDKVIREDTAALAAEDAILKRIFVKHRDLMMEYGPDKITQAAESVAYDVGDIAHISDEQINGWVRQVEYILGARP